MFFKSKKPGISASVELKLSMPKNNSLLLGFLLLLACMGIMTAIEYLFCWECVWQQPDRFPLQSRHQAGIWAAAAAWNSTRHFSKASPKVVIAKIYLGNFGLGPLEMFFSLQTCCWSKLSNGMWAIDFLSRRSWVILLLSYAEAAGL